MEESIVSFLDFGLSVLKLRDDPKHVSVFLQLRRMQEMIAQMQAQMRMKPGDD